MCKREACVAYFKKDKGFERPFVMMRRKWESLGRTAGTVKLAHCSREERRAMEQLLGRSCPEGDISFSLAEFETALGETRFQGISLKALLELYFGMPMVSNRERQDCKREEKKAFFERCRESFAARAQTDDGYLHAAEWISCAAEEKQYGYHTVVAEWNKNSEAAERLVRLAGEGLSRTAQLMRDGDSVRLAVLAAQISGNPHFFDRGTTGGLLVTHALCCRVKASLPANASEYAALYAENGIQLDEISSTAAAFGVHLEKKDGIRHPAFEGFIQEKEAYVIMQANLETIQRAYGEGTSVFVVENEMVFSHLCAQARDYAPSAALVCTSGQPRKAALQLLDLLVKSDMHIYYAGDLDPDGLRIADRLAEKYGERLTLWHMAPEDYRKAISHEVIDQRGLAKMEKLKSPLLRETAACIAEKGRAGYQEKLLDDMTADLQAVAKGKLYEKRD